MSKETGAKKAVAIGTFDGVHRGHQRILASLREVARRDNLESIAYAFIFPPRLAVRGETQGLLLPEEIKVTLLKRYVDRVERVGFADISGISPDVFVRDVLIERLAARAVVVGQSFRFGHNREGDLSLLQAICERESVSVAAVPAVVVDGSPVSSTRIRHFISMGMIEDAAVLLGRPPLLVGRVVHGDRLGRKLGHPTANLSIDEQVLLPRDGLYLVRAFWNGNQSPGLLYVGTRPTVNGSDRRCEVHLFKEDDCSGLEDPVMTENLYGKTLEVHILRRVRDDRSFPSLAELQRQMERDVEGARVLLATSDWPKKPIVT